MDVSEALSVTKPVLDANTTIVVATIQAFRRENKDGLRVYQNNGALMSHFQGAPDEILRNVERGADAWA